jgi:quercetin dioxygenase-like cupin family protein
MNPQRSFFVVLFLVGLSVLLIPSALYSQDQPQPVVHSQAAMKLATLPNVPSCVTAAVESGDPTNGPSVILMRFAAGCAAPWHWHTPDEVVMTVSGTLRVDMKDAPKPAYLHAGDYAMAPSHHIHRARCVGAAPCLIFLQSAAAFDIHYVNGAGNEIPLSEAIKPAAHKSAANQ